MEKKIKIIKVSNSEIELQYVTRILHCELERNDSQNKEYKESYQFRVFPNDHKSPCRPIVTVGTSVYTCNRTFQNLLHFYSGQINVKFIKKG
jgi:hypothetical protein